MKTAISIPGEVFERAERLARSSKKSRSQLYGETLQEYVACHAPEAVSEALDRVFAEVDPGTDDFVSVAASRVLERTEW